MDACGKLLTTHHLDALLVTSPAAVFYLSGFLASTYSRPVAVVLSHRGKPTLYIPSIEWPIAERLDWGGEAYSYAGDGPAAIAMIRERLGAAEAVGIEHPALSLAVAEGLRADTTRSLVDISAALAPLWWVKDAGEVNYVETAATLCSIGFQAAAAALADGASEVLAKGVGDHAILAAAAELSPQSRIQLFSNVIAGHRTAAGGGHDLPTGHVPALAEPIFHVWGVNCEGYWALLSRTSCVGTTSSRVRAWLSALEAAKEAAMAKIRPGLEAAEVYRAAVEAWPREGPPREGISLGRGIGASMSEGPVLAAESRLPLEAGMVLRVGPEAFDEFGGYGLIDTIAVTADGCRNLTQADG